MPPLPPLTLLFLPTHPTPPHPAQTPQKSLSGIFVTERCVTVYQDLKTKSTSRFLIFRIDDDRARTRPPPPPLRPSSAPRTAADPRSDVASAPYRWSRSLPAPPGAPWRTLPSPSLRTTAATPARLLSPRPRVCERLRVIRASALAFPEDWHHFPAVYDFQYISKERGAFNKIVFVLWSPNSAKVKNKMMYASTKDFFKSNLDGVALELQARHRGDLLGGIPAAHRGAVVREACAAFARAEAPRRGACAGDGGWGD